MVVVLRMKPPNASTYYPIIAVFSFLLYHSKSVVRFQIFWDFELLKTLSANSNFHKFRALILTRPINIIRCILGIEFDRNLSEQLDPMKSLFLCFQFFGV